MSAIWQGCRYGGVFVGARQLAFIRRWCSLIPARPLAQDETIVGGYLRWKLAVGNDPTSQPESGSRLMV